MQAKAVWRVDDLNALTGRIIGAAIQVHRGLGPGLLESVYQQALCLELAEAGLSFTAEKTIPASYKGLDIDLGFRADIVFEDKIIVELKATETLLPVHGAQVLTYLRMSGCRIGLLVNFNILRLKDGLRRFIV